MGLKVWRPERKVSGKMTGLNPVRPLKLPFWSVREVYGIRSVAVKCVDIRTNSDCEGSIPEPY